MLEDLLREDVAVALATPDGAAIGRAVQTRLEKVKLGGDTLWERLAANVTNEGGAYGTFRLLKNVMGLWLLQRCRAAWAAEREWSYEELTDAARESTPSLL